MKTFKKYYLSGCSIAIMLFILFGCITSEQTIYLGDTNVSGPITPPPTHINVNKNIGDVTFSPRYSVLLSNNNITGTTEDHYNRTFYFNDGSYYRTNQKNLEWDIVKTTIGLDMDAKLSEKFSLFGGFNYSMGNKVQLAGGNVGMSFHNHNQSPVIRWDLGLTIQKYEYKAITIVHTKSQSIFGSSEFWDIYVDEGNSVNINPFILITVNSDYKDADFNWFVPFGFFTQNLLGFEPGTSVSAFLPFLISQTTVDKRADMLAGFIFMNPGVSYNLNQHIKILLSTRIIKEIVATKVEDWFFMPSVQIDFQL